MKKTEDKNLLKNEENQEAVHSRIFKTIKDLISNGNDKINELFVKSFGNNEELLNKYEEVTKINPIAIPSIVTFALPLIMHNVSVQAIVNSGTWVSFFNEFLHGEKKSANEVTKKDLEIILQKVEFLYKHNADFKNYALDLESKLLKNEDFEKSISQLSESLHIDINELKNEVNEKLNEIKEELSIVSSSNIEKMEAALCKDPESSSVCSGANAPELFRPTGPMWIDFEKEYVVERKEVDEIIDKVKNSNQDIIIIKGKPASGKSVVLRSVGYRLINDGFTVYYIQLKFFQSVEVLEFNKIRHGIVIVDDAHLNIELTEKLIRNKSKEIKLIIGTRGIRNYKPDSEAHFPELLKSAIAIQAVDAAEKIIDKFNEIHNNILDESIKNEILKKSGNNLWILAWRLKAYKRFKNTNPESLYLIIREHISVIHNSMNGYYDRGMEDAFYILSVFYRYEIPLRKPYVESFTNEEVIRKLAQISEILLSESREGDYLSLHHSEIAKVYFETFQYFADFGYAAKKKVKELAKKYGLGSSQSAPKTDAMLIINYTETFPEEFNRFIGQVPDEIKDILLQNKYFISLLPKIFKNYQPFDDFKVWLFYSERLIPKIYWNKNLKSEINRINKRTFEDKINKWENLRNISYLLKVLKEVEYGGLNKINKAVKPEMFEDKIEKWESWWDISYLLKVLKEVEYGGLNKINKAVFEDKIEKWENAEDVEYLLKILKEIRYEKLNEVLKDIEPIVFEEKIRKCDNPRYVGNLLKALKELEYQKLNRMSEIVFEEKIRKWNNPGYVGYLLEILKEIRYEKLNEVLKDIEPIVFEEKIRKCDNPRYVGYLLEILKYVKYEKLNKLLREVSPEVFEKKIWRRNWQDTEDKKYLEQILKELHYPHLQELKELLEPAGLWLIVID